MINFFLKKSLQKKNIKLPLQNKFPWINQIDNQIDNLIDQDINIRINEITDLYQYLLSIEGKIKLKKLYDELISFGYPKEATKLELDLLIKIFDKSVLNNLLYNPTVGLDIHKNGSEFNLDKVITDNFGVLRSPKGKIFIVGSSNTLLPVITSMILSYILGNVTVVQLSSLHINSIPNFINSLSLNVSKYIHFTKLDHNNVEDKSYLQSLLTSIKWDVVNLWGGDESLKYYFGELFQNRYRPRIVSMEPLTGITIIDQSYLKENQTKIASELSHSISIMGQQLCSSPTIGFIISNEINDSVESFCNELVLNIEKRYVENNMDESNSIKLDRMLNNAMDGGSRVYRSHKYKNNISVVESVNNSIFIDNKANNFLDIHQRKNFIEFIKVKNFDDAIKQIRLLPSQYSFKEIQKVQTILPFGNDKFIKKIFNLAKKIGAYRIIDSEFTLLRHSMESLDGYNLINEFSNQIAVSGKNSKKIN